MSNCELLISELDTSDNTPDKNPFKDIVVNFPAFASSSVNSS